MRVAHEAAQMVLPGYRHKFSGIEKGSGVNATNLT
jgi:hypothetical protein